jgi:hypothetical protein
VNPPGKISTAGETTQVIRKAANTGELIHALKNIVPDPPVRHENSGIVYYLEENINIDGWPVVVKIIYMGRKGVSNDKVRRERRNLDTVGRLYGCGRTEDSQYYYLIMPYMGLPFRDTNLSPEKAEDLMNEAKALYKQQYCIQLL